MPQDFWRRDDDCGIECLQGAAPAFRPKRQVEKAQFDAAGLARTVIETGILRQHDCHPLPPPQQVTDGFGEDRSEPAKPLGFGYDEKASIAARAGACADHEIADPAIQCDGGPSARSGDAANVELFKLRHQRCLVDDWKIGQGFGRRAIEGRARQIAVEPSAQGAILPAFEIRAAQPAAGDPARKRERGDCFGKPPHASSPRARS